MPEARLPVTSQTRMNLSLRGICTLAPHTVAQPNSVELRCAENGPCTACGCTCGEAQGRGRGVRGSGSPTLSSRVLGNILREHPAPNSLIHFTVELCLGSCNHPFSDAYDLADSVCARSKWPVRIVTGVDASTSPCHRELGGHRANGWREKGRL